MFRKRNMAKVVDNNQRLKEKFLQLHQNKEEIMQELILEVDILSVFLENQKKAIEKAREDNLLSEAEYALLLLYLLDINTQYKDEINHLLESYL